MENLTYMLQAYFHQDWNNLHATWQEVIDDFVQDDPETVSRVPGEIFKLLGSTPDDSDLRQRLLDMGMDYYPEEGYRPWLASVGERIADRSPAHKDSPRHS
ncbi:contact-dependent growth inhibition system immunity protein [Nocardioides sp. 616]|uniref:contact-dependent growth inhibition system immunity protein n=1 Tax=Nocardioides sp. 616 TaxID=2268090 RepID=UPI000CE50982|nr:contact-dependent growth inhibition system immunity protein [Nocardioides sp. 616]